MSDKPTDPHKLGYCAEFAANEPCAGCGTDSPLRTYGDHLRTCAKYNDPVYGRCAYPSPDIACDCGFDEACRAHSPAVQALESQPWIRISEKLPDLAKKVLISSGVRVMQAERQPCSSKDIHGEWYWWDGYYLNPETFTHWREMPAPPVESLSKSKAQE